MNQAIELPTSEYGTLEFIDEQSDHGERWADVNGCKTALLFRLEQRGLIELTYTGALRKARPTDAGLWAITAARVTADEEEAEDEAPEEAAAPKPLPSLRSLTDFQRGVLRQLHSAYPRAVRVDGRGLLALVNAGLAERSAASPRLGKLTEAGYRLSGANDRSTARVQRQVQAVHQLQQARPKVEKVQSSEAAAPERDNAPTTQPVSDADHDCETCIHRRVLERIAARYPQVAELREVMQREAELLDELGLNDG